jgi:hypothetical protein
MFMCILCSVINYEKISHSSLQMNAKLKPQELYKFLIQKKWEHSNITSEYVQKCATGIYIYIYIYVLN